MGAYGGLCGMPACGQAVECGVCDTPELWRGAAGLCARVRACAGAADSLYTYTQIQWGGGGARWYATHSMRYMSQGGGTVIRGHACTTQGEKERRPRVNTEGGDTVACNTSG